MKSFLLPLFILLGLTQNSSNPEKPLFTIETANEGSFDVVEILDKEGVLEGYTSKIKAPVCEEGVCYDVDIIFNWNLIGAFKDFELVKGSPLTKLDHVPFTTADYSKLQGILTNFDLVFTGMSADKLVTKTKIKGLDAYSGATVAAIKNEVIEGALFTCHTLWHIANGAVLDSIKAHTSQRLDKQLVQRILSINTSEAKYYLINNLSDEAWKENYPLILNLIKDSEGYFAKNTFEEMPNSLYQTPDLQDFIELNYASFDYYTRIAILNQFNKSNSLPESLLRIFLRNLDDKLTSESVKVVNLVLQNGEANILNTLDQRQQSGELKLTTRASARLAMKLAEK